MPSCSRRAFSENAWDSSRLWRIWVSRSAVRMSCEHKSARGSLKRLQCHGYSLRLAITSCAEVRFRDSAQGECYLLCTPVGLCKRKTGSLAISTDLCPYIVFHAVSVVKESSFGAMRTVCPYSIWSSNSLLLSVPLY
jgi:hypothetical protein